MTPPVSSGYGSHVSNSGYGNDCKRPVVLVMQPANMRTNGNLGMLGGLLAGIPALMGALATGASTYIFNRND